MNINQYTESFGNFTFEEMPYSEVDALVFCALSYVELEKIVPKIEDQKEGIFLKDIDINKIAYGHFKVNIRDRKDLIIKMLKSKRYQEVKLNYSRNILIPEKEIQFFAYTYFLPNDIHVICFRGTDEALVGWKEDLNMSFEQKIPSQDEAVKYVEEVLKLGDYKFYITGHSKGGNLAFYSTISLYEKFDDQIIEAINFDGPGFLDKEFISKAKDIKLYKKLIKIVPECSIVGMMMNNHKHLKIVNSNKFMLLQHDPVNWSITKKGTFDYKYARNPISIVSESALTEWLASIPINERKLLADLIFYILGGANENLGKLTKKPLKFFKSSFKKYINLHHEDKVILISHGKNLYHIIRKTVKEYKKNSHRHVHWF